MWTLNSQGSKVANKGTISKSLICIPNVFGISQFGPFGNFMASNYSHLFILLIEHSNGNIFPGRINQNYHESSGTGYK